MLKNVYHYSEILKIPYRSAKVTIHGIRNGNPLFMLEIRYHIEIDADANERQLNTWLKNILEFGAETNMLKCACLLESTLKKEFFEK